MNHDAPAKVHKSEGCPQSIPPGVPLEKTLNKVKRDYRACCFVCPAEVKVHVGGAEREPKRDSEGYRPIRSYSSKVQIGKEHEHDEENYSVM